jgi:transglutaminase-like putative cysteine protease
MKLHWKQPLSFLLCLGLFTWTGLGQSTLRDASRLQEQGDFSGAASLLKTALHKEKLSVSERHGIKTQIEMLDRILKDYSETKDTLFANLSKAVKDLTRKEFEQWMSEGRFDSRVIDGQTRFTGTSVSNLFFRYPELNPRRLSAKNPKSEASYQKTFLENARAIKKAAQLEKNPYVLPQRFECTMTVTAEKNAAPAGQTVRAWLPITRSNPFQTDIKLLSSTPTLKVLAPEDSPIRSAYFEQVAIQDQPTKFQVAYQYTSHGVHFALRPGQIRPVGLNSELKKFTAEAPHVVFTDKIKGLANELAGKETNPMLQAKAFFDWIAGNIKYSYAREYSTLTNISDYCFGNRYGDCGQEALLFITLCRSKGIPARWQTGWSHFPGTKTMHDWTEIYLAPYGWMPVDPWAGIYAMRYCTTLKPEEQRELRDFYFGGLDQYRLIANSDHNQLLDPPKQSLRSDDVDFQRGELEWGNNNLYFDKYSYDLKVEPVKQ